MNNRRSLDHHQNLSLFAGLRLFALKMWGLFRQPLFIAITIIGNLVILASASTLYLLEYGVNPHITSFLDTLWWAISTVTTVGYGDVIPTTQAGRIVGILTMIFGISLFWSYTALFAEALLTRELMDLEDELQSIESHLAKLEKRNIRSKEVSLRLIQNLEGQVQNLKKNISVQKD
jgi:voltage-gated potassium channel